MENDFDLIVVHDDLIDMVIDEHLCFESQGLLVVRAKLFFKRPYRVLLLHQANIACILYRITSGGILSFPLRFSFFTIEKHVEIWYNENE